MSIMRGYGDSIIWQGASAAPALDFVELETVHQSGLFEVVSWRCLHDAPELQQERQLDAFALSLVSGGAFVHHYRDRHFLLDPGSLFFMAPHTTYRTTHPFGIGDRGCRILVRREVALEALAAERPDLAERWDACRVLEPIVTPCPPTGLLRQVALLERCQRRLPCEPLLFEETTMELLRHVLTPSGVQQRRGVCRADTAARHRQWTEAVKHFLARHIAEPLSLRRIARQVHTSPYHLSRVFKASTGLSLHRYIVHLRLAVGLERLLHGEEDLSCLAHSLGFSSHSHFTRAFRSAFGRPPSEVRSVALGTDHQALLRSAGLA